jgi:hypothetical protein
MLSSYGMGGDSVDRAASGGQGEDYLVSRVKAIGVKTLNSPYQWSQVATIVDDVEQIVPAVDHTALVGDSLGDNELGDILDDLGSRAIDLIGGFQGSEWGKHTTIPANCKNAIIIYNPNVLETVGLGAYPLPLDVPPVVPNLYDGNWYLGNNGQTKVKYIQIYAAHPDDWGAAQDIVFTAIQQLKTTGVIL